MTVLRQNTGQIHQLQILLRVTLSEDVQQVDICSVSTRAGELTDYVSDVIDLTATDIEINPGLDGHQWGGE